MNAAADTGPAESLPEWCANHFDHIDPTANVHLHEIIRELHTHDGVVRSDQWGGFWVASHYRDVLAIAQNWQAFSSGSGVTIPSGPQGADSYPAIPEMVDPPLHREYKRLINAYFTPAKVQEHEAATRALVHELIDGFVEQGRCEFMADFASPLPGLVFFLMFLHAPRDELDAINQLATTASVPTTREAMEARQKMLGWIAEFVEQRRASEPRGDVVDAILAAEIDGAPITDREAIGMIQLLLFGGLDTTAGALGHMLIRMCRDPEIADRLRAEPELLNPAIEEMLRLDGPFVFIARTVTEDITIGGADMKAGDKVLISWLGANRDETEFACPHQYDPERASNRHIAFGAGPHRCAGSNLARMNLRISLDAILSRLHDIRLADPDAEIPYHSLFSRSPASFEITFTPGERVGAES